MDAKRRLTSTPAIILTGLTLVILGLVIGSFLSFTALAYAATPAEQGRAVFEQKCQACHTIGGGRLVGPDLKDIAIKRDRDWLVRFITTPDKLITQGDPIAKELIQQYGMPMPNLGITEEEAEAILAYFEAQSIESKPTPTPPTTVSPPATTTAISMNPDSGSDLFTGKLVFKNGGPACLSCHNVRAVGFIGGGTVGKDLTTAYSVMGEAGITSLLKTTPFPMMKEIYTAKPLTNEEIASLLAFLKDTGNATPAKSQNPSLFFIIGGAAALLIIGIFQWLWRGRLSGVRRPLVKGGAK